MEQIDKMTWRYFLVLVNNLSPRGAVAMRMMIEEKNGDMDDDPQSDEAAANAYFASVVAI